MSSFKTALIKPVYDIANFGHDTTLPFNCITGTGTTSFIMGVGYTKQ